MVMIFSKQQMQALKNLMTQTIQDNNVVTEESLAEKISHLPTKDEFYSKMDELLTEIKANRQEQAILSHRVSRIEDKQELA